MLERLFVDHVWTAVLVYSALSMSDYRLSIAGKRWWDRGAKEHYDLGGSYELNPPFEADIDAERPVSPKHLRAVAATSVIIVGVWWLTAYAGRLEGVYLGVIGFFILPQVTVHIRHANNIALFSTVVRRGGVTGKTAVDRWLDMRLSGVLFWLFSAVWAVFYLLTSDPLFLGGVASTALVGARFWIFGDEAAKEAAPAADEPARDA